MKASAAPHLVAVPMPPAEAPDHLDTITEFADFMRLSRSQVERLVGNGLPALNVSLGTDKRSLRFDRAECLAWLRERNKVSR